MSGSIEDRFAYAKSPAFAGHIYEEFSYFYVTIGICTAIGVFLVVLNVFCCCCSKYSDYWQDRHTGNRWIVSLWTATAHKQPPLDLAELERGAVAQEAPPRPVKQQQQARRDYLELQKRESDI